MGLDPAWIALIGTLCGGLGLKLLEWWIGRSKLRIDEADKIRGEQRQEILGLRADNKALQEQLDNWRMKYYDLREKELKDEEHTN